MIRNSVVLGAFIVATLLVGCRQSSIGSESEELMRFGCDTISSKSVGLTTSGANPLLNMGVYAAHTANGWTGSDPINLMSNLPVVRPAVNDQWDYAPRRYWPGSGKMSFFAYAPFNTANLSVVGQTGVPQMEYTVAGDMTKQVDLLVATALKDQEKSGPAAGRIDFSMAHALTQITFAAKVSDPTTDVIRVTGVVLKNLHNHGFCAMDAAVRRWTTGAGDQPTAQYALSTAVGGGLVDPILTTDYQTISATDGSLFLLPQTMGANAVVDISYSVNGVAEPVPVTIKLSEALEQWQSGESIRFLIHLSVNRPFKVNLGYSFVAWGAQASDVTIDENPYLYVSHAEVKSYDAAVTRVYFYTNQPADKVFIDPSARMGSVAGALIPVKERFMDISAGDQQGTLNFHYNAATKRGYIDFVNVMQKFVTDNNTTNFLIPTGDQPPVLVRLRAGKLDNYITITPHVTPYVAKTSSAVPQPPPNLIYYAATFHRRAERGERIITFYMPNNFGWSATIAQAGQGSELVIDRVPSPDYTENRLYTINPRDAEGAPVSDGGRSITGRGRFYIRVGWRSPATTTNRYATINMEYWDPAYPTRKLKKDFYCRQGEEPDYVCKSTDDYFSPYNLVGDGLLASYPSQGGFISQWGRPRFWPLVTESAPAGYPVGLITEELDKDVAICPEGYAYPDKTTVSQYVSSPIGMTDGFCADGYFDRRGEDKGRVDPSSINNAAPGVVWFDVVPNTARSIFFPTPGYRDEIGLLQGVGNGRGSLAGMIGYYWTGEQGANNSTAVGFRFVSGRLNVSSGDYDKRFSAGVRCIKLANPVLLAYNANGGQDAPRSSTGKQNAKVSIPRKIPHSYWRPGYFFANWQKTTGGGGVEYLPGTEYQMSTSNQTLYAQWSLYYRVDFRNLFTAANAAIYLTSNSYNSLSVGSNGTMIPSTPLSGRLGIDVVANAQTGPTEKAYRAIEFHKTIQTADSWTAAYNTCKNLNDPDRTGAQWRLPRLIELLLVSQHTPVTSWDQVDLFGGSGESLWSGTQIDGSNAHRVGHFNSRAVGQATNETNQFRCVRELP